MTPAGSLLIAEGLHKSYGPTPALDGADFSIHPGEVVAVMGPSGSGKSTLLHCLAGIVTPDSGTVNYSGRALSAMPDSQRSALRRGEFGFVFQFGQLVPELSCVENVALPLRLNGVRRKEAESRALA
ncbi:ABC transporter ATP-binding protein, partial [Streptomyces sp. MCAF7]